MNKPLLIILGVLSVGAMCLAGGDTIVNPVLAGFYPDPSICRVGDDYYVVCSSFAYYPGIPVFHSRDLAHWDLIGHVLDRPSQLNLDSLGVSRGIFAPSIRFHGGTFYVTCTLVDRGGNFVVTSQTPGGPWSDPVWLPPVNGIDPSLFFDGDSGFIVYNSIPPEGRPLYDGHRTIRMARFDPDRMRVTGAERILVNGGTDIRKKPVWIEAPHIFRKSGYYYLIAAEGGTGESHSEVVFRSARVWGPYLAGEHNPILTQRNLDPRRAHPVTCTGHADFVETPAGDWWSVFLGCRPYPPVEKGFYNTGRETFMAPVRWEGGWPVVTADHELVKYSYPVSGSPSGAGSGRAYGGNFTSGDDFSSSTLGADWVFLRTPRETWYSLTDRPGYLAMKVRPETCSGVCNPSFLGWRQSHASGEVSVSMQFAPSSEREKAGILVFQNERHYYFLCRTLHDGVPAVQLCRPGRAGDDLETVTSLPLEGGDSRLTVLLKVESRGGEYAFFYARTPGEWHPVGAGVNAEFLSTRTAGGFVGCLYALYATSSGAPCGSTAYVDWFHYRGDDEIYR